MGYAEEGGRQVAHPRESRPNYLTFHWTWERGEVETRNGLSFRELPVSR